LTSYGDHDTRSSLELIDVHNSLVAELLEVQFISDIEVSGKCFGGVRKKFRTTDDSFDHIETLYGIGYRYKDQ
jgi:two-component system response regulator ChvI